MLALVETSLTQSRAGQRHRDHRRPSFGDIARPRQPCHARRHRVCSGRPPVILECVHHRGTRPDSDPAVGTRSPNEARKVRAPRAYMGSHRMAAPLALRMRQLPRSEPAAAADNSDILRRYESIAGNACDGQQQVRSSMHGRAKRRGGPRPSSCIHSANVAGAC